MMASKGGYFDIVKYLEEKKIHQVKPFKSEVLNHPSHENELTSIIKINTPEVQSEKEKENRNENENLLYLHT